MGTRAEHWGGVYAARDVTELSWFEVQPEPSLAMLDAAGVRPGMSVIDVGAGASGLAGDYHGVEIDARRFQAHPRLRSD